MKLHFCDVILGPHISEKSTMAAEKQRQVVFKVRPKANKRDIKLAVESLFNVKVEKIQVLNQMGKKRQFKQIPGRRNSWKKAYVLLKDGHDIEFNSATT